MQVSTIQAQDVQQQNKPYSANPIAIILCAISFGNGRTTAAVNGEALLVAATGEFNNRLRVVGDHYDVQPYDSPCHKQNNTLCYSLVNVIRHLIREGIHGRLLK